MYAALYGSTFVSRTFIYTSHSKTYKFPNTDLTCSFLACQPIINISLYMKIKCPKSLVPVF